MSMPLLVEIIAYAPTAYSHCTHCEVAWREMGKDLPAASEEIAHQLASRSTGT